MTKETSGSSTKQLKRVLGFGDLMGVAVGQIIGSGIMTLLGAAIAMTGRSVPIAFLIAAVITVCQYLSLICISGTVRLRGGQYTMVAMLAGQKFAGAQIIIYVFANISISMYAISFAEYFISLFGFGSPKLIALAVLTLFYALNCFGIDKFAKAQNLIVIFLIVALGLFAAFGLPQVQPDYFADSWMPEGALGLLQASALLTFAVGGANSVINLSAEAKNPTRDIPLAMIVATLSVAVLYGVIAVVAAGVLPVSQVAGQNLALVAEAVLSRPLFIFFMVCGAGFALISTMNAQFAWGPKPVMQACDDGWLPSGLAKLSKWNTPIIILTILYAIGVVCILTDLSVAILGNMTIIALGAINIIVNANIWRLEKICPEEWKDSKFKVSSGALKLIAVVSTAATILNVLLNASRLPLPLLGVNVAAIAGGLIFGTLRSKHAHVDISYEKC